VLEVPEEITRKNQYQEEDAKEKEKKRTQIILQTLTPKKKPGEVKQKWKWTRK